MAVSSWTHIVQILQQTTSGCSHGTRRGRRCKTCVLVSCSYANGSRAAFSDSDFARQVDMGGSSIIPLGTAKLSEMDRHWIIGILKPMRLGYLQTWGTPIKHCSSGNLYSVWGECALWHTLGGPIVADKTNQEQSTFDCRNINMINANPCMYCAFLEMGLTDFLGLLQGASNDFDRVLNELDWTLSVIGRFGVAGTTLRRSAGASTSATGSRACEFTL